VAGKRGHKLIDHTADMGVEGWGATLEEAFEEAASAMFDIMVSGESKEMKENRREIRIDLSCVDCTEVDLLVEFLNALITKSDIEGIVFDKVKVEGIIKDENGLSLSAVAEGTSFEIASPYLLTEVKAATYYGARVERGADGLWYARCVVDL